MFLVVFFLGGGRRLRERDCAYVTRDRGHRSVNRPCVCQAVVNYSLVDRPASSKRSIHQFTYLLLRDALLLAQRAGVKLPDHVVLEQVAAPDLAPRLRLVGWCQWGVSLCQLKTRS